MNIQIIQVPYDSGHEGVRTGKGPDHFIQNGIEQILQKSGHVVNITRVESRIPFSTEIGTTFEVNRLLAECVRSAVCNNRLFMLGRSIIKYGCVKSLLVFILCSRHRHPYRMDLVK